ncbi:MAG: hypothetical protein HYV92_09070 [Candidatus Rokubacteria bacterium]|nr:hypothetical protein [Candidatus Rokubacteria bacterium]MBI2544113.1 hypothetical protein [Candidatus Rokubacteria bacterium]MBI2554548.1 hypothetical protein [Candidatus Rokubacteria bacterium]
MKKALRVSVIALLCLFPVAVSAQPLPVPPAPGSNTPPTQGNVTGFPNTFPHPTNPWTGVTNPNRAIQGSVIGYIQIPSQQVVIQVYVPGPGSFSGGYEAQVIEIPGYVVAETTTGYIYPPRWGLQEVTPGVYQWVPLPEQFQAK